MPFKFAQSPTIIFGSEKRSELVPSIRKYGGRIVLLTGKKSFTGSKYWEELQGDFEKSKISYRNFVISNEPSPEDIDQICRQNQLKETDAVVAIGGGSVLDAGKAVSAMIGKKEPVKTYLEGVGTKEPDGSTLPFIALPTTSGTGSECTKNAVISEVGENGFKKSLRHDNFVPKIAIVDPELTLNCPKGVTAASGMDAFTQLLESYLSTNSSPMTDSLALGGLEKIKESFENVMGDGNNLPAREGLAYASMISGITLANAGLGTIHGFASSIGGRYDIPHGVVCGTLMLPCNKVTIRKLKKTKSNDAALVKYATVGRMFCGVPRKSVNYHINYLLELISDWTERFGIPRLSQFDVQRDAFPEIVKNTGNKNNPVDLNEDELLEVLESRH